MSKASDPRVSKGGQDKLKKRRRRHDDEEEAEETVQEIEQDAREAKDLEALLFGRGAEAAKGFGKELDSSKGFSISHLVREEAAQAERDEYEAENQAVSVITDDEEALGEGIVDGDAGRPGKTRGTRARAPAWVDEDEASVSVNLATSNRLRKLRNAEREQRVEGLDYIQRLRRQHARLNPGTGWAKLPSQRKPAKPSGDKWLDEDVEGEDGEELEREGEGEGEGGFDDREEEGTADDPLLRQGRLVVRAKGRLPAGILEVTRMRDANEEEPCKGVVQSVQFHSNAQLLLTASLDKTLRFFQVWCSLYDLFHLGVVNVYDRRTFVGGGTGGVGGAAPLKSLMNLTTGVDCLRFSPDAQVLAMASRLKRDAVRLVHVPSATVFSNWPSSRSPMHYVHALDFSPGGGYLAVGNARGKVLLYRLHHYDSA
eukprot:jgi/Mesen1/5265/ME000263S04374